MISKGRYNELTAADLDRVTGGVSDFMHGVAHAAMQAYNEKIAAEAYVMLLNMPPD
jgi:hypothetical protein